MILSVAPSIFQALRSSVSDLDKKLYLEWTARNGKVQSPSSSDFEYRVQVFLDNIRKVNALNSFDSSAKFGLNKFADLTTDEFMALATGAARHPPRPKATKTAPEIPKANLNLARRVNWLEKHNVVAPPDNQFGCGCSYAFSAIAATRAAYAIFVDPETQLKFSQQIIVNCGKSLSYKINGCEGGSVIDAFEFIKDFGLFSDTIIPFTGSEQACSLNYPKIARLPNYKVIGSTINDLLEAIQIAPVAVSLEMVASYQFYNGGVMDIKAPCGFYINHSALAVGYDLDAEEPYIVFQNSFGVEWGEAGYFKYAIGDGASNGICGIANEFNAQPVFV
jgi:C1A family cysteine protease